jgi:hypothetical protein
MTLPTPCPDCEDGLVWRSKYGGNDPDVWAVTCDRCHGDGEIPLHCEGCREDATEFVGRLALCPVHAADAKTDVFEINEDR